MCKHYVILIFNPGNNVFLKISHVGRVNVRFDAGYVVYVDDRMGEVIILARDSTDARRTVISVVMIEAHLRRFFSDNGEHFVWVFEIRRQLCRHCSGIATWCVNAYTVFLFVLSSLSTEVYR